jgi:hypothetical protein
MRQRLFVAGNGDHRRGGMRSSRTSRQICTVRRSPATVRLDVACRRSKPVCRPRAQEPHDELAMSASYSGVREKMVGRDGIEPPTPGFSVICRPISDASTCNTQQEIRALPVIVFAAFRLRSCRLSAQFPHSHARRSSRLGPAITVTVRRLLDVLSRGGRRCDERRRPSPVPAARLIAMRGTFPNRRSGLMEGAAQPRCSSSPCATAADRADSVPA